ncbi:DUF4252 domain-containing protein [Tenacibaculum discolor]|uniref:DUF4252 domain-containing protein n=1 Tax=Tenacibaculum discolor TaxID=361581 RepID=A0A2G1BVS8_9FLAO|nr:DUF4252 domain-containing protein [Tenacibaculum discolor]MDP2540212.1 DUF4252 domain-containing protein [Tenacibaculum discolor]PHN98157.1 hypothetical protein CSC81_07075 [Tenacibaculum discolor]PHO01643.1 hypothetical protein CSC82_22570 [Rhodobacteraceae bacterium 4F10]
MKRIATIFFCFFVLSSFAQKENFKTFYQSNKDRAEVSLNIPSFFANMFISDEDTDEFGVFLKKSKNYKIMVFNNNMASVQKDFKKFARRNNLKTLVRVKDGKERVTVYFRKTKDRIKEIIVNVHDKSDEMVLLGIKTNLTMDELSAMVEASTKNGSVAVN